MGLIYLGAAGIFGLKEVGRRGDVKRKKGRKEERKKDVCVRYFTWTLSAKREIAVLLIHCVLFNQL